MNESPRWRRAAAALFRAIRDGWLIFGLALALFLALEAGYRAQHWLRRALARSPETATAYLPTTHPYAHSAWFPVFLRERDGMHFRWEPFVYGRVAPQRGRYVNVDSAGLRVVPRFHVSGGKGLRVFFLGGSTTWGWFDRDSSTRPAVVARRLAEAGFDATVVNLAQTGYVSAQELLVLVRELQRGNVPDAVIFWDGVNDIPSARTNRRPGVSIREFERDSDAMFNAERRRTRNVGTARALRSLARSSALLSRALDLTARPAPTPPSPDPIPFCRAVMGNWLGEARVVDALARAFGFTALMIWQPQWATSGRPQSAFERHVAAHEEAYASAEIGLEPDVRECARVADSLVAAKAAGAILNWAGLHTDDPGTVYLDQYSHTTERATAVEADTLFNLLMARLPPGRRPARNPAPPR